jgi:hypothetical protein
VSFRFVMRLTVGVAAALIALPSGARAELPDPIRFGISIEMGNVSAAEAWLDQGLDPDFLADRIGSGLMIGAWEGNIPMMELFLSRGADVNKTNPAGEQALMHAAWRGRAEAVRWLLDRGARVNRNGLQWSALHYAVFAGNEEIARLLIDRGADVNARSTNGSSVLMMAARQGRDALARTLVTLGADTKVVNDRGEDALLWALRYDHVRIAAIVASPGELAEAARRPRDSVGKAGQSMPVPERIEALLREMRLAESEGRLTEELRAAYAAAVTELEKTPATPAAEEAARADLPKALEITARRGEPGAEEAMLIYERGPDEPLAPPKTTGPKKSKPKPKKPLAPPG